MAYNYEQRNSLAESDDTFRGQVVGALFTHAAYLYDGASPQPQGAELRIALSIISNIGPFITTTARAILYHAEQGELADVTSLTDGAVLTAVQTSWPMLVAAWTGEVVTP